MHDNDLELSGTEKIKYTTKGSFNPTSGHLFKGVFIYEKTVKGNKALLSHGYRKAKKPGKGNVVKKEGKIYTAPGELE